MTEKKSKSNKREESGVAEQQPANDQEDNHAKEKPKGKSTKTNDWQTVIIIHVIDDPYKLFKQIAFQSGKSATELLRQLIMHFEEEKPSKIDHSALLYGDGISKTTATTFNLSFRDKENLDAWVKTYGFKSRTDLVRYLIDRAVSSERNKIDIEQNLPKPEQRINFMILLPKHTYSELRTLAKESSTTVSELIRNNIDRLPLDKLDHYVSLANIEEPTRTNMSIAEVDLVRITAIAEKMGIVRKAKGLDSRVGVPSAVIKALLMYSYEDLKMRMMG